MMNLVLEMMNFVLKMMNFADDGQGQGIDVQSIAQCEVR